MDKTSKIYIAGHQGMVGSAIVRKLEKEGYQNLVKRSMTEFDLREQPAVKELFEHEKPEVVVIAAAKVGGILANNIYRAEFIYDNIMIESNLIHQSYLSGVKKLIFLGSSCIYPRDCPQPIKEEYLLTGPLEPTNEPYAVAKIAGIKLCENFYRQYGSNFYSVMPTNLYGPNDNFDLKTSHVLPALIRKFHEAKISNSPFVPIWGTGEPRREFLYVDDLAGAIYFLMNEVDAKDIYGNDITHLNIGTGEDVTIKELAELIKNIVGYKGSLEFDKSKPSGTPRKLLNISRINKLGWKYKIGINEGIFNTYEYYKSCLNSNNK